MKCSIDFNIIYDFGTVKDSSIDRDTGHFEPAFLLQWDCLICWMFSLRFICYRLSSSFLPELNFDCLDVCVPSIFAYFFPEKNRKTYKFYLWEYSFTMCAKLELRNVLYYSNIQTQMCELNCLSKKKKDQTGHSRRYRFFFMPSKV